MFQYKTGWSEEKGVGREGRHGAKDFKKKKKKGHVRPNFQKWVGGGGRETKQEIPAQTLKETAGGPEGELKI